MILFHKKYNVEIKKITLKRKENFQMILFIFLFNMIKKI